jgi:hypothetical protein
MNNGGGSGGGSTGGGKDKVIVGVKDGDNITFSKTAAEIVALGDELKNYDIILTENGEKFIFYKVYKRKDNTSNYVDLVFLSINVEYIVEHYVHVYESGIITHGYYSREITPIPDQGDTQDLKVLIAYGEDGREWANISEFITNNPLLQAVDMDGALFAVQTNPLMTIVGAAIETSNVHVNLVVLKDIIDAEANIANTYNIYRLVKVDGVATGSPYGIFANGIDKNIKMDAEGNFSYMES